MDPLTVALAHYRHRRAITRAAMREATSLWRLVDRSDITGSWAGLAPRLVLVLTVAQRAAAAEADAYVDATLVAQGVVDSGQAGQVSAAALSGSAADGRPLATLLLEPAIAAKTALARGLTLPRAMGSGLASLTRITATEVADAGRVADGVALTARRRVGGYVRMTVGKSCSRCVILAGRWYRWNTGFQRHPHCDCVHVPAQENRSGDLMTDPEAYFRSLSTREQDRIFTHAGAEAIRDGADMNRVVNARRGMYTAGGRSLTREATTRQGIGQAVRLTPEQIYREASGDRDEALRLLRRFGYLL